MTPVIVPIKIKQGQKIAQLIIFKYYVSRNKIS